MYDCSIMNDNRLSHLTKFKSCTFQQVSKELLSTCQIMLPKPPKPPKPPNRKPSNKEPLELQEP